MTSIGMNWILCSFKTNEAVDEVLNGGPWYVNGYIVGMDRWSPIFDPYSFKGISAPVWIRLPCLPLYYWDEDSFARITSRIGTPLYLDGNTFRWGKREFARICVKIDLEKKLPNGVWIDGLAGRFFQRVEYEKLNLLCYHCGRARHELNACPEKVVLGIKNQAMGNSEESIGEESKTEGGIKNAVTNEEYGPWIHVQFKNRWVYKNLDGNRTDNAIKNKGKDNLGKNIQIKGLQVQNIQMNEISTREANADKEGNANKEVESGNYKEGIILNNAFEVLNEDNEIEGQDLQDDAINLLIKRKEGMKDNAVNECKSNLACSAKIKLAKELRSLGPVDQ
ncbi:uncharacterized protein LOC110103014 [Dendrobium catenatum]|uniref:uncharacterized protein LOC110103014 n=1 Tax=Dendrobium catenatum TaxID=906689 RepID=UPI0009F2508F|nr:uncharacterized protein LOC110103014 [Dendrobium catenatum]